MAGRPKKLGPEDQNRILQLRDQHGMTLAAIAKKYSVGIATVSRICSLGSGTQTAVRSAKDESGQADRRRIGVANNDGAPDSSPGSETGGPQIGRAKPEEPDTAGHAPRPVLSLQQRTLDQRTLDQQDGERPVTNPHVNGLRGGPAGDAAEGNGGTTSNVGADAGSISRGATGHASGMQCAAREIRDSSAAVAQALERWRETRAQEDYVRVDQALADIRRALAKAEVELWTWQ